MLGFSAKLVRLNFLFVEPFGRPGGRLVGVMYFCPQRGSYVGGSHAAGLKAQLSNKTKSLYGANPFSTNTAEYCCCGMPDSPPVLMRLGNANINDILLFNNRENPDIVSSRTSVFVRVYRLMCKLLGRKSSLQGVVALDRCSP